MIRFSEPVYPTGGLAGQGILHLLGTPPFSPLALVLREAGQNIWDARKGGDIALRMLVRIRTLEPDQARSLRDIITSGDEDEDEPEGQNLLLRHAERDGNIRVLEICDFGTTGLMGSIDPQEALSNFTRFFFSFGDSHADGRSGGTYGYGRSSLYLAGKTRTIFVDSLTTDERGNPVRRFMGSRIGDSYERMVGGRNRRFVGRHFWGSPNNAGDGVLPLTGIEAERHAVSLGLPRRGAGETGTSILIPWPGLVGEDEQVPVTGNHIAEILLRNFWPKLVRPARNNNPPMEMRIEDEGLTVEIPDPATHPVYGVFAAALNLARTRNEAFCTPVTVGNARKVTGHVAFVPVLSMEAAAQGVDEGVHNCIALMRSSELVVKYLPVPQAAIDRNWAGVFLCSDADDVRRAFAMAEPPAHDDWVHEGLSDRNHKMWVKTTKAKLVEHALARFVPRAEPLPQEPVPSIAGGLDEFSRVFLAGDGDAAAHEGASSGGGGRAAVRLGNPVFEMRRFDENGNVLASFKLTKKIAGTIKVRARVDIEGAERGDALAEIPEENRPRIIRWRLPSGEEFAGDQCTLSAGGEYRFEVQFRGRYAIKTRCEIITGA